MLYNSFKQTERFTYSRLTETCCPSLDLECGCFKLCCGCRLVNPRYHVFCTVVVLTCFVICGVCMCGFCNVCMCMYGCVYVYVWVCVCVCMGVCMYGFCNVWMFVFCNVWVFVFCNVWVFVCMCFVMCETCVCVCVYVWVL